MQINISEEQLQTHINNITTEAVKEAMEGYKVREAIGDKIVEQVTHGKILQAIEYGLKQVDLTHLSDEIGKQIMKTTVKAMDYVIRESFVDVAVKISGIQSFDSNYKKEKEKIRVAMFKERK